MFVFRRIDGDFPVPGVYRPMPLVLGLVLIVEGDLRNLLMVPEEILRELLDDPRLRDNELRELFEKPLETELRELPPLLNLNWANVELLPATKQMVATKNSDFVKRFMAFS